MSIKPTTAGINDLTGEIECSIFVLMHDTPLHHSHLRQASSQIPCVRSTSDAREGYRLWRGRSGQRYVFSVVSPRLAAHFGSVIAILVAPCGLAGGPLRLPDVNGAHRCVCDPQDPEPDHLVWFGVLDETCDRALPLPDFVAAADAGHDLHVHLLARSLDAQFSVLQDLSPTLNHIANAPSPAPLPPKPATPLMAYPLPPQVLSQVA